MVIRVYLFRLVGVSSDMPTYLIHKNELKSGYKFNPYMEVKLKKEFQLPSITDRYKTHSPRNKIEMPKKEPFFGAKNLRTSAAAESYHRHGKKVRYK